MLSLSLAFTPPLLKAITLHPENPLLFDFVIDRGDSDLAGEALKEESGRLFKYFLTALTTPEDDLWVNLSPTEQDRIIPEVFGTTEMGQEMLAQDYLLKQLSSSLMYPKGGLGERFWQRVYDKAYELYGTTEIPVKTLNRVWIMPAEAVVYEHEYTAFVVKSRLKVLLEEDYLDLSETKDEQGLSTPAAQEPEARQVGGDLSAAILRDVILPEIEQEVNQGENFAKLRQMYHSLILAGWFKQRLRESLLGTIYVDQNKVAGVEAEDKEAKAKIYQAYLDAFTQGVYNLIEKEYDTRTQKTVYRKYFSGGVTIGAVHPQIVSSPALFDPSARQALQQTLDGIATGDVMLGQLYVASPVRDHSEDDDIPEVDLESAVSTVQTYTMGPRTGIASGRFEFLPGTQRQVLIIPESKKKVMVAQLRDALREENITPGDYVDVLHALQNLVAFGAEGRSRYLDTRRQELWQLADDLRQRFVGLQGRLRSLPRDIPHRQALMRDILTVIEQAPDEFFFTLVEEARNKLENLVGIWGRDIEDWDKARINLVLNSGEPLRIQDTVPTLDVDLLSLVKPGSTIGLLNYSLGREMRRLWISRQLKRLNLDDFLSRLDREYLAVVLETLVVLLADMGRIDRYNQDAATESIYPSTKKLARRDKNRLYYHLRRSGNKEYVTALRALEGLDEEDPAGRAESFLRFMARQPRFHEVRISANTARAQEIAALYKQVADSLIFGRVRFEEQTVEELTPPEQESDEVGIEDSITVLEEHLYEVRWNEEKPDLKIPDEWVVLAEPAPPVEDQPEARTEAQTPRDRARQERQRRKMIFVKPNRGTEYYRQRIQTALDDMYKTGDVGQRLDLFLGEVWPQFLIARADDAVDHSIEGQIYSAAALFDSSLARKMDRLVVLSRDVALHEAEIRVLAAEIRGNPYLKENNVFFVIEILTRLQRAGLEEGVEPRPVKLLSSVAYEVDEIRDMDVEGVLTYIRYLGDRIDNLSGEIAALGFVYTGDTHGSVVKGLIDYVTYRTLLSHLFDVPITTDTGEAPHALFLSMRQAVQRDFSLRPSESELPAILAGRYLSTEHHERQHIADEIKKTQENFRGVSRRVEQEVSAYLASIAQGPASFTDLVAVMELYRTYLENGFLVLDDPFGVYRSATEKIILLFAVRLGVDISEAEWRATPRDAMNKILQAALDQLTTGRALQALALDIQDTVHEHQRRGDADYVQVWRGSEAAPSEGAETDAARPEGQGRDTIEDGASEERAETPEEEATAAADAGQRQAEQKRYRQWLTTWLSAADFRIGAGRAWQWNKRLLIALMAVFLAGDVMHDYPAPGKDVLSPPGYVELFDTAQPTDTLPTPSPASPKDQMTIVDPQQILLGPDGRPFLDSYILTPQANEALDREETPVATAKHVARTGESLSLMSFIYTGSYWNYPDIYYANQDQLPSLPVNPKDFHLVTVGQELVIPGALTVLHPLQPGDSLTKIAAQYYSDEKNVAGQWHWRRIQLLNDIRDPNVLPKDGYLEIPLSINEYQSWEARNPAPASSAVSAESARFSGDVRLFVSQPILDGLRTPVASSPSSPEYGGIDFKLDSLNLQIAGAGGNIFTSLFDGADMEALQIEGFYPVVIRLEPATNLPQLLGLPEGT